MPDYEEEQGERTEEEQLDLELSEWIAAGVSLYKRILATSDRLHSRAGFAGSLQNKMQEAQSMVMGVPVPEPIYGVPLPTGRPR